MTKHYINADQTIVYSENDGGWSAWVVGDEEADGYSGSLPAERLTGCTEISAEQAAAVLGVSLESVE